MCAGRGTSNLGPKQETPAPSPVAKPGTFNAKLGDGGYVDAGYKSQQKYKILGDAAPVAATNGNPSDTSKRVLDPGSEARGKVVSQTEPKLGV